MKSSKYSSELLVLLKYSVHFLWTSKLFQLSLIFSNTNSLKFIKWSNNLVMNFYSFIVKKIKRTKSVKFYFIIYVYEKLGRKSLTREENHECLKNWNISSETRMSGILNLGNPWKNRQTDLRTSSFKKQIFRFNA